MYYWILPAKTADGETAGLIAVGFWVNVGAGEVQAPRFRSGGSSSAPEVAVCASIDGITANASDGP